MKRAKKILALLLSLVMVLGLMPTVAMAQTEVHETASVVSSNLNPTGDVYNAWKDVSNNQLFSVLNQTYPVPEDYGDLDHQQFFIADFLMGTLHAITPTTYNQTLVITATSGGQTVNVEGYICTYNNGNQNPFKMLPLYTNRPLSKDKYANNWVGYKRSTNVTSPLGTEGYDHETDPARFFVINGTDEHFYIGFALTSQITADTTVTMTVTRTYSSGNGDGYATVGSTASASYTFTAGWTPAGSEPEPEPVAVGQDEALTVTPGAASTNNGKTVSEVSVKVDDDPKATVSTSGEEVNASNVDVQKIVTGLVAGGEIHTGANSVVFTLDKTQDQESTAGNSVTYEVTPKLSVNGGDPVTVTNDQLTGSVSFYLPAPVGAQPGDLVTATHTYGDDPAANITAGSETFQNLVVNAAGNVPLTLDHFSNVTLTLQGAPAQDARIYGMNGYLADYFVLNFYVITDAENPSFSFTRSADGLTLEQVTTKAAFCQANKAVYYVEKVAANGTNGLGLQSPYDVETYMVSVKFFTKFLDQTVTMSMKNGNTSLYIKGYKYDTVGSDSVALSHSYSFIDFVQMMKLYQGGGFDDLYDGLSSAAVGARNI